MIDTPFGRVSARQLAGLGLFALLAWIAFQAFSFVGDLIFQLLPAVLIFIAGAIIFTWPVKTVPPERIILLALGIGKKPFKAKAAVKHKAREKAAVKAEKAPEKAPAAAKVIKAQATVGEPFKIVGILRDPKFGKPLASCSFEVFVDGVSLYKGVTDEQGGFEVVYVPQYAGVVKIVVKPEGVLGAEQSIEVTVGGPPPEALR